MLVALAESYVDAAKSFGALVTVDQDSVANARKNVFPEFLKVNPYFTLQVLKSKLVGALN